jgi:hypothetical protein
VTNLLPHETNESVNDVAEDRNLLTSTLTFRTYSYRETLFAELERLAMEGRRFDGLIVDLMQTGFTLPLDSLVRFHSYGKRLLKPQGVMLFIKADGAMTLTKDDPGGGLTLNVYDSPFGIFARYPMLADYVCATVSGIDRRRLRGGGNTLANHILYTSTPVLTPRGASFKTSFELPPPQNWLLQLIDDYSSAEAIGRLMEARHNVHMDETLRLMQELEAEGAIYPIFSRIQFLANCYHNRKPFRLGRYMVAAGIITPSQLEELLELQQEEGWGRNHKTFLGLLAVRKNYINTRELEVLLHDQFIYGGYHKVTESDDGASASQKKRSIETMRDSMIGSLGAIDSAGLLQSIATAKKTGLLTVENRDKAIVVAFNEGRPTHARLDKLVGYHAIVEFLVAWSEGIFVFRDKGQSRELDETCVLTTHLDRILIDSALYQDQINRILQALPSGRSAILERVWNFEQLWPDIAAQQLRYVDETVATDDDKQRIFAMARMIDGLTTLDEVIKMCEGWSTHTVLKAVQLLLDHKVVNIQQTSLFRPLTVFQRIAAELQEQIGRADNKALLEQSLHYVHGDSNAANRFNVDFEGRVSVNLSQVKASGTPVSVVLLELRRWMEAYLAYARRQLDPHLVDSLVAKVVHGTLQ